MLWCISQFTGCNVATRFHYGENNRAQLLLLIQEMCYYVNATHDLSLSLSLSLTHACMHAHTHTHTHTHTHACTHCECEFNFAFKICCKNTSTTLNFLDCLCGIDLYPSMLIQRLKAHVSFFCLLIQRSISTINDKHKNVQWSWPLRHFF